jgi:3-hydroxyisobutyrate dehydrogenase-like beta-hydroxyacid dehydrogenase
MEASEMTATRAKTTSVGFVGLGHMAARYLAAGYPVYGESRSRKHAQHLVDEA